MDQPLEFPLAAPGRRRLVVGADHAGWRLKDALAVKVRAAGYEVIDVGTSGDDSVDYPDFAAAVARAVAAGDADRGVIVCGTGIGVAMTANKVPGVRAAVVHDAFTAYYSREHNDANVLCLGARVVGEGVAESALATFLRTDFGGGRHARRVEKITATESEGTS
ncbi:MAG TPA: ribose 5-phosphate isomerase B [Mycobacteriales bacterium]|nr:ribose 5-phosphate isomerase B [Mycobacteriales bacterium]